MRVFARSPHKLPDALPAHENLEIAEGGFADSTAVEGAIAGADFVVCAAGDAKGSKVGKPMLGLVKDIVAAMRAHGVRRLSYQAGAFSPAPGGQLPLSVRVFIRPGLGTVLGIAGMLEDNDAVMAYLKAEAQDLDWTVTRPGGSLPRNRARAS